MEVLLVDILEVMLAVSMEEILLVTMVASMEAIQEVVVMEAMVGVATVGASTEDILWETAMEDIMGVLPAAEDQIVD